MKSLSAPERALKTIAHFQKETGGLLSVSGEQFTGILAESIRLFCTDEDEFCMLITDKQETIYSADTGRPNLVLCNQDDVSGWEKLLAENRFILNKKNDNKLVRKKFRTWMLIPVLMKKNMHAAIIIARSQGRFTADDIDIARQLGVLFSQFLRDIRRRNRKTVSITDETRHRVLLRTQASLDRKQPEIPELAKKVDYSACLGSDMGQMYRSSENTLLICVCDVTADDINRQIGLVYLDTWFSIFAQTSLDALNIIRRLNVDMLQRTAECYASIALVRYNKKTAQAEITGAGSTVVFFFIHATMSVKTITFGAAAGVKKEMEQIVQRIPVEPGDIICLCTDGLTDTRKSNSELFGKESISELIRRNYFLSAEDLATKMMKIITENADREVNADDRTLQVLKFE